MEQLILHYAQEGLYLSILISLPVLLAALIVGLIISILQAATQIQEQTLTFVPKFIAIAIIIYLLGNWMLTHLVSFAQHSFLILSEAVQ